MTEVMEWPSTYSAAKVLPLVITWSLRNFNRSAGTLVEPIRLVQKAQKCGYSVIKLSCFSIVKERVRNGMRCLQVEWKKLCIL